MDSATPKKDVENDIPNTSGMGKDSVVPEEIKGWSWGAFGLNGLWAVFNNTWIGLLVLIPNPFISLVVCVVLGVKGREWAWKNKKWESIDHFNSVQRKWSIAALWSFLGALVLAIVLIALMVHFKVSFVTR